MKDEDEKRELLDFLALKKKNGKLTVVNDDLTKMIVSMNCIGCGKIYEKDTYFPTDKIKDLGEFKKIGLCKSCMNDRDNPTIRANVEKKLQEIVLEMKKRSDKNNEMTLV